MKTFRFPPLEISADVRQIRRDAALREKQDGREAALAWLVEIETQSWGRCPGYAAAAVAVRREFFAKSLVGAAT